jgi:hypothetical protein
MTFKVSHLWIQRCISVLHLDDARRRHADIGNGRDQLRLTVVILASAERDRVDPLTVRLPVDTMTLL